MNYSSKKTKICFIGSLSHIFTYNDYLILKKHFEIEIIEPPKNVLNWIRYPFKIKKLIKKFDLIFCWFAGWHSFFPVLFANKNNIKSIVVAGGYDAVNVPEINYGAFSNLKERIPAKYVLKNSCLVLAVSEFTKKEIIDKVQPRAIKIIYNGVKTDKFKSSKKKENIITTIGSVNKIRSKIKGLDTFAKISLSFPSYRFIIIGDKEINEEKRLKQINPNLFFTGRLNHDEVLLWLEKTKIYCQLSYIESFGLSLAEAMSCNCVPIVTDKGALPEVIGELGFSVPYADVKATINAVNKAINFDKKRLNNIRNRIMNNFDLKIRENELVKTIEEI